MSGVLQRAIEPSMQKWLSLSSRERALTLIMIVSLLVGGVYWGIIAPLQQRTESVNQRLTLESQQLDWVKAKADEIVLLQASSGRPSSVNRPLNQVVSSSVRRFNIDLLRVQPRGQSLQVSIKPVAFNNLIQWLDFLQTQYGVSVEFVDINATTTEGEVEVARLQLIK